jgi:hypothetical protein
MGPRGSYPPHVRRSLSGTLCDEQFAPPAVAQYARLESGFAQQADPFGAWKEALDVKVVHDARIAAGAEKSGHQSASSSYSFIAGTHFTPY